MLKHVWPPVCGLFDGAVHMAHLEEVGLVLFSWACVRYASVCPCGTRTLWRALFNSFKDIWVNSRPLLLISMNCSQGVKLQIPHSATCVKIFLHIQLTLKEEFAGRRYEKSFPRNSDLFKVGDYRSYVLSQVSNPLLSIQQITKHEQYRNISSFFNNSLCAYFSMHFT